MQKATLAARGGRVCAPVVPEERQPSSPESLKGKNGGADMRKKRISAERMEKGSSVLCGKAALCRCAGYGSPLPKADAGVLCPGRTVYRRLLRRAQKNGERADGRVLSAVRRKAPDLDAGRRDPATILGGLLRARASGSDRLTAAHRVRFVGVEGEIKDQPSRFRPFSQVFASASKAGERRGRDQEKGFFRVHSAGASVGRLEASRCGRAGRSSGDVCLWLYAPRFGEADG